MTQSLNPDLDVQLAQTEVFDQNGRIDPVASAESARLVLAEINTVRIAGSSQIDAPATKVKRVAAKRAFLASR